MSESCTVLCESCDAVSVTVPESFFHCDIAVVRANQLLDNYTQIHHWLRAAITDDSRTNSLSSRQCQRLDVINFHRNDIVLKLFRFNRLAFTQIWLFLNENVLSSTSHSPNHIHNCLFFGSLVPLSCCLCALTLLLSSLHAHRIHYYAQTM